MSGRTTLKTYFLSGATPTEANFADLIDSTLIISEDLTDSLSSTSSTLALTASAGKSLNDSIIALTSRVVTLEDADNSFASNYYTKTETDALFSGTSTSINNAISPLQTSVNTIDTKVSAIEFELAGKAETSHPHAISQIVDLQSALDAKAAITYVNSIEASLAASIAALNLGTDSSTDIASLQGQINTLNTTVSGLPTTSQLDAKADDGHDHAVADISDIGTLFYNKSETDTLLSSVTPEAHSHVESDITDLDKYTTGAVDLKLSDHNARTDNPHGVTKAQVSLGNVENLSVIDLFQTPQAQALANPPALTTLEQTVSIHNASQANPHNVTKAQVSLGNVPNINFQSALDAHINATNPHNINLSYFDVYSRAETDSRVQLYLDTLRYAFKPTSPTDGAGAVGDLTYHDTGMYFKFGATDWRQIIASKVFNDGSPSSKTEIETPKLEVNTPGGTNLFSIDNSTNTTNINTTIVSIGGTTNIAGPTNVSNILNVTGDVSLGNSLNVSNLFQVDKTTNTTSLNTTNVSIGGATNIDNTLNVTGAVSLGGSTFNVAGNTTNISSTHVSLGGNTLNVNGQVSLASGMTTQGAVSIGNTLNVSAHSILSSLRATTAEVSSLDAGNGTIETTGTLKGGTTNLGATSVSSLTSAGALTGTNLTLSGNLTVNGTTTTIDTTSLVIEDNQILLNKNQTGTPPATLKSGIVVDRGTEANAGIFWDEANGYWKVDIGGQHKTLALTSDLYSI